MNKYKNLKSICKPSKERAIAENIVPKRLDRNTSVIPPKFEVVDSETIRI